MVTGMAWRSCRATPLPMWSRHYGIGRGRESDCERDIAHHAAGTAAERAAAGRRRDRSDAAVGQLLHPAVLSVGGPAGPGGLDRGAADRCGYSVRYFQQIAAGVEVLPLVI